MRFKILVIDDEPILRNSLEIALKVSGYEVITAQSGEEGLDAVSEGESGSYPAGSLAARDERG